MRLNSTKHHRFALAIGAFITALPGVASAYCRATTCAQALPPADCVPGRVVDSCQLEGVPLFWPTACVSFSVQKDGSPRLGITAGQLEAIVRRSFDRWQQVSCEEGGAPGIQIQTYPQVECAQARYNSKSGNQNLWRFCEDSWPHRDVTALALTLLSFNPRTGEIYDADVELNAFDHSFSLDPDGTGIDLEGVVQHETGRFLGLANSSDSNATMSATYDGGMEARTLEPDDAAGICQSYPATNPIPSDCNAEPRHGFSSLCDASQVGGSANAEKIGAAPADPDPAGCSCTTTMRARSNAVTVLAMLGAFLQARRLRRRSLAARMPLAQ